MGQMKKNDISVSTEPTGPDESIETGKFQMRQIRDFQQDSAFNDQSYYLVLLNTYMLPIYFNIVT